MKGDGLKGFIFTSESVTEGHPDKVCDGIADAILDAYIEQDPHTRINIEVLAKHDNVVLAGEITSNAEVDRESVAREVIKNIGYTDNSLAFSAENVKVHQFVTAQSSEIDMGVTQTRSRSGEQGVGDQGMMFGYATRETVELMPLPIMLAHRITRGITAARKNGEAPWMGPDGKSQVSVMYSDGIPDRVTAVVVSTQHSADVGREEVESYIRGKLPELLGEWHSENFDLFVNPTGSFIKGGPEADTGLTGRKIIVDTYGGMAAHGGGSFSGKDPSKVDRSGAYFTRYVARNIIEAGLADRAEIQVGYAIGEARPVSINVSASPGADIGVIKDFVGEFDFRPAAVIERLGLLAPIYSKTTNYGHFGKPGLSWEKT